MMVSFMNAGTPEKLPCRYEQNRKQIVRNWTCGDVYNWLVTNGFGKYASLLAYQHQVDGNVLLMLNEEDLRSQPLGLPCLGDIKRLSKAISSVRNHTCIKSQSNTYDNGYGQENVYSLALTCQSTAQFTDVPNNSTFLSSEYNEWKKEISGERFIHRFSCKEELIRKVESPDTERKSIFKLCIAFIYCSFSFLITAFVMVYVHDRVPDMNHYPPLPDLILDSLPVIPWGFQVCEIIGVLLSTLWLAILFFHKHRIVIMRRMLSLVGTVFLLRCITMVITSLSVPGVHIECETELNRTLSSQIYRAYHIWSRLGMSIKGVRTCGDYIFSGHTTAVTLLNHFITEYTPLTWGGLHTCTWVLNLFAVFFILAGHEHYSIDVFIAFYISSRMFLYYHAYAYHHFNVAIRRDERMRIWFPLEWFFEAGGYGRVENEFEVPKFLTSSLSFTRDVRCAFSKISTRSMKSIADEICVAAGTSCTGIPLADSKTTRKRKNGKK